MPGSVLPNHGDYAQDIKLSTYVIISSVHHHVPQGFSPLFCFILFSYGYIQKLFSAVKLGFFPVGLFPPEVS